MKGWRPTPRPLTRPLLKGPVKDPYWKVVAILASKLVQTHLIVPGEPWAITAAMSPRPTVRVAAVDAAGTVLNEYRPGADRKINADPPDRPWAVYLANKDRQFELLCFDLDSKGPNGVEAAHKDAATISAFLQEAGLDTVVCQSGPTGGRHVWTALKEPVDPENVATLARLTRHLCPTLDLAPLTNPVTGCVRPPGAPHRTAGHSTILNGNINALTSPQGTQKQVTNLIETLAALINNEKPGPTPLTGQPLPRDQHGRLYLPGTKRALPTPSTLALEADAACGDASAVLWTILIGAASARWHYQDIAALAANSPGMEHVRTYRDRSNRVARTRIDSEKILKRQWDKAVKYVARNPRQIGEDPTFERRASEITQHIRSVQERAKASVGRWTQGGGPTDWRVLITLSLYALQALTITVEADIRRLAITAGIGRETARTALLRLAEDGWITQTKPAHGPHGAHWKINASPCIHNPTDTARSQADPRPAGAGAAERNTLQTKLTGILEAAAHDLFTNTPGLGPLAGNLYSHTTESPRAAEDLAHHTGIRLEHVRTLLHRLAVNHIITLTPTGWQRAPLDQRTRAAKELGAHGTLEKRRGRYKIERELWAWWNAEQTWMKAPRKTKTQQRPVRGQLSLLPDETTHAYGPHPRDLRGRLDWREARRIIEEERGGHAHRRLSDTHKQHQAHAA